MDYPSIHQPIQIGRKRAKNRIEVSPAAPFLTGHDGSLSPEFYAYNESLAKSGAGIITLGVTPVDPVMGVGARCMSIGTDLFISDFNTLAELFHKYGALASAELVYTRYMLSHADEVVNGTSTEEVEAMIKCFADGAERLLKAGFDIAFVHGGHGNVPAMFFSQKINKRTDRFGGSFEGRCQFAIELLDAIRERVGQRMAIEWRISAEEMLPGSTTLEETIEFCKVIEPKIDLLHVSRGLLEVDELVHYINAPLYLPRAMNLPYAAKIKEALSIPVTVVGSFNLDLADQAISSGQVDMVSMIRNIYADNRCVRKALAGKAETIRPCVRCNTCIDRTHSYQLEVRCATNPIIGRESRFNLGEKASRPRKVAIVGAGPGGMQAALTCAARGHQVTIYERNETMGGKLALATADALKEELKKYLDYQVAQVNANPSITVKLGVEATPEMVQADGAESVIVAVGSNPVIPGFARGENLPLPVFWVGDAEVATDKLGDNVAIAGAGMTGMEFALSLVRQGKKVTLIDPLPYDKLGAGATAINIRCLKELLNNAGVVFKCDTFVDEGVAEGAKVHTVSGEESVIPCDSLVFSLGFRPDMSVLESFEGAFPLAQKIGDCRGFDAPTLFNATQSGFDAAMLV